MDNLDEYLKSYWIQSTEDTQYPSLNKDITTPVAIIGGGIVGLTTAYLLKKKGIDVVILEASKIIQGSTAFTTAKVTSQHGLIYDKILTAKGHDLAMQYAMANESSIDFVENTINELNIQCDFERMPAYVYTNDDNYVSKIEKEFKAASSLGIKASLTDTLPLNIPIKKALVFENQGQFHPRKYLLALSKDFVSKGGEIYENTEVQEVISGEKNIVLTTRNGFKVTASKVIISSHFPCYDGLGLYLARLKPERSYIVATTIKETFPKGMFINAENPTRSLRYHNDNGKQLVLVGGESHKVAHGDDFSVHYDNLEKFAKEVFTVEDFSYRWSNQDYKTIDDIPYIGRLSLSTENIFVATGFAKWGMTNGTTAARILADKILGEKNPYEEVFNPSRSLTLNSLKNIVKENFDVAKELVLGKLKSSENIETLGVEEGRVVTIDGNKYGAYKDNMGLLHIVDITCTHLGCELKWNDAEKSWDCPCHGSRFTYDGDILNGPATHRLNHYMEKENKIDPNL